MKKTIILASAIVLAGCMLPIAVSKYKSYDRTVDVRGLCEREVKADKVIWPLVYKVMDDDLSGALNQTDKSNAAILEFLKAGGIEESEINISPSQINDKLANEYGNNDRVYRFLCTNVITVCTNNVDAVLKLQSRQDELLKKGIPLTESWENRTEFRFEALNEIKPEMIAEATAGAREAAQKFANDSNSHLGKIKNASQGVFSIEDRDSNTPEIKKVRVVTSVTYYLSR